MNCCGRSCLCRYSSDGDTSKSVSHSGAGGPLAEATLEDAEEDADKLREAIALALAQPSHAFEEPSAPSNAGSTGDVPEGGLPDAVMLAADEADSALEFIPTSTSIGAVVSKGAVRTESAAAAPMPEVPAVDSSADGSAYSSSRRLRFLASGPTPLIGRLYVRSPASTRSVSESEDKYAAADKH